ncbi:C6 zinc finger protein [Diplocarpon rosae]|nr:C6 zinc finger protein [Diplocarpon rosae]
MFMPKTSPKVANLVEAKDPRAFMNAAYFLTLLITLAKNSSGLWKICYLAKGYAIKEWSRLRRSLRGLRILGLMGCQI